MKIENVWYELDWAKFKRGTSVFIPCIDENEARAALGQVTRRLRVNIATKVVVQDGIKGLRVWRM